MLLTLWLAAVAAPAGSIEEASYLVDTGRADQAAVWLRERLGSPDATGPEVAAWLRASMRNPDFSDRPSLPLLVGGWAEAHPEDPWGPSLVAHAWALTSWGYASLWSPDLRLPEGEGRGSWCAPAWQAVAVVPADAHKALRVLQTRRDLGSACGWPVADDPPWWTPYVGSDDEGDLALARLMDEGQAASAQDLRRVMEEGWSLRFAAWVAAWREDPAMIEVVTGSAVEAMASDVPWRVEVAGKVFQRLKDPRERQAWERLRSIDPKHPDVGWWLRRLDDTGERTEPEVPAPAPLSPQVELLFAARAAVEAGEERRGLATLDRWWRRAPDHDANLVFAEQALAEGARLRSAAAAARLAVAWFEVLPEGRRYGEDPDAEAVRAQRAKLVHALTVVGAVAERRGRWQEADLAIQRALVLDPDHVEARLWREVLYTRSYRSPALVASALAVLKDDRTGVREPAMRELAERIRGVSEPLAPRNLAGWVELAGRQVAKAEPVALPRLPTVPVQIGGADIDLASLRGPMVIDVWATWCGPCVQGLPEFDRLAQVYEGSVRFVALSIDDDEAVMRRHLQRQPIAHAEVGWGGEAASTLGADGIPQAYVVDADGQVVFRGHSSEVEAAVRQHFGGPRVGP